MSTLIKRLIQALSLFTLLGVAMANDASQNILLQNKQASVEIHLKGNATTGYQWFLVDGSTNPHLLSLQSSHYVPNTSDLVGAGGESVFVFSVDPRFYNGAQTTSVRFVYQRSWEPGQNITTETVTLTSLGETGSATPPSATPNWLSLPPANS